MNRDEFNELATNLELTIYPEFEKAVIGIVERFGMEPVVLYDRDKVIDILIRGGMDDDSAEDWFSSNTLGTWAGNGTPAFAQLIREVPYSGQPEQN